MKDLKKLLLGAAATTAAAGVLFAADASVAHAAPAYNPFDENGNLILGGKPDVNPAETTPAKPEAKPEVKPVEENNSSNLFKPGLDKDGVPSNVSGNPAVAQPEEKTVEDPNHSPYEYEAETKEKAIEIGQAMLDRSKLEGTALAQVNNHVDAVQTASGKWTPTFSYVEKAETPAKEDKKDEVKKDDKKKDESKKDESKKDSDKKDSKDKKDNKDNKANKNESKKDDKKKSDKDSKVVVANEKAKKDNKAKKDAKAQKANAKLPATGVVAGSVAGLGVALVAAGSALSFRRRK
ncbi:MULTISPECIES: LPXTG cell wall anchor domain-containing protein [Aerococcus]|uniref:LPXTG cell wall anchor domain-containing protein n=1 Tax=Aerococcus TaxID=1375 RepID=UPI000DCBF1D7|nr:MULTISPECIES: LPXTG cell wall anchor domain-containing protein [Aerococcus]KAA9235173.1 LPXTG cell wall anchor domain-containing protein [Aerococcus mictus]MDK6291222.1 LPXTG cell wall anchor domain-containing protein [Aerococcus urinae]MDK6374917.1 LPXTG cell wall anchor domain-containing protein [Aerococcus urinae]MDK6421413.1 LPXTG cell wall anchor domain-containing protein [Aerococcus urinae]MDK8074792.1 LPXTG cell wall anchor domain-containing protein [Aerococcus urinae]